MTIVILAALQWLTTPAADVEAYDAVIQSYLQRYADEDGS